MAGNLLIAAGALLAPYAYEFTNAVISSAKDELMKLAAEEALERLGLAIDLDGKITKESITKAICEGVLGGQLQFSNLFDRDAVKADIQRIALEKAGEAFGFEGGLGIEGVKQRLVDQVLDEVRGQVESGSGVYLDAARDLQSVARIVAKGKPSDAYALDMRPKAIANRSYQAKYRAGHSKHWEPRT